MSWRKHAKQIAYWTLPQGINDLIRTYLLSRNSTAADNGILPEERELLAKNRILHNRHAGERCFILATGPSIKKQNLKLLQGEVCLAVSNFFVHPDYRLIKPRYYCVAPYHQPITEEAWQAWLTEMETGTGDAAMFFSLSDRQRNHRDGKFMDRQVYYLKFGNTWESLLMHGVDLTQPLPGPQSVTIMALLVALYMGFRTIYLLGCDHDWILHLNKSSHFYDENHHALNRHGYNEWLGVDLESYFHDYIQLWQQYKIIRQIADKQCIHILNATDGGLLDVFPRVGFQQVFDQETRKTNENVSGR